MKTKRFSEEQILYALRQAEGGEKATEVCRKMGISEQTFYTDLPPENWSRENVSSRV